MYDARSENMKTWPTALTQRKWSYPENKSETENSQKENQEKVLNWKQGKKIGELVEDKEGS